MRRAFPVIVCLLAASAWSQEAAKPVNPNAVANPLLIKLPFSFPNPRMENTPVIFKGVPLLVQNVRPINTKADGFYLWIEDLRTSYEVARFGQRFSFVSAFVNGDEMNVFATENTDDDWTHDIYRFSSTDLKNWKQELVIARDGDEHLFNASVCKDDQGYLMAFESNKPVQWSFRFARSKDLSKWEKVPDLQFTDTAEKSACANPTIRYCAPYYYVIYGVWCWLGPAKRYEYLLPETKYSTLIARSKDLVTWDISRTKHTMLDPIPGEGINNSDADLFEFEGNTYVYYATGNQQDWGTIRVAMHPGPMKEFLESYFPPNVPMVKFDAKAYKYVYP